MIDRSERVYFARCIGPLGSIGAIKIGCSHRWNERVKELAANLPFNLELLASVPGGRVLEAFCHMQLKPHRIGGEFFAENEQVMKVVNRAATTGRAYFYVEDSGSGYLPKDALSAFMKYHGIALSELALKLGMSLAKFEKEAAKHNFANCNRIAAAAFIAQSKEHFVHWPDDALRGLCGQVYGAREDSPKAAEAA